MDAASLRLSLVDLPTILARLGVRFRGSGARLKISCPVHTEKTPSCSIAIGPSGTLRAHCLGCKWTGDVFALIAAVSGLSAKEDFRRILEIAQGLT